MDEKKVDYDVKKCSSLSKEEKNEILHALSDIKNYTEIEIISRDATKIVKNYLKWAEMPTVNGYLEEFKPLFAQYKITILNKLSNVLNTYSISWISDVEYIFQIFSKRNLIVKIIVNIDNKTVKILKAVPYCYKYRETTLEKEALYDEEWVRLVKYSIIRISAITFYVLNYSNEVRYKRIKIDNNVLENNGIKNKRKQPKKNNVIMLKSERSKYVFTAEQLFRDKREYEKHKKSWYVRGYYQHYGKGKVLKYIPPRINKRGEVKKKNIKSPKRKYVIKNS